MKNAVGCRTYSCCLCRQTVWNPIILHRLFFGGLDFGGQLEMLPKGQKKSPCSSPNAAELLLIGAEGTFSLPFGLFFHLLPFMMGAAEPSPIEKYSEGLSTALSQPIPFVHPSPAAESLLVFHFAVNADIN